MLSAVSSLARSFLRSAAAQPQEARGEDTAHLAQVRRKMGIGGVRWHGWEARSCRPTEKNSENNLLAKARENKGSAARALVIRD